MNPMSLDGDTLKRAFKEALAETLREERDLLHQIFAEALEDLALAEAVRQGRQTERIERAEVFDALEGKA